MSIVKDDGVIKQNFTDIDRDAVASVLGGVDLSIKTSEGLYTDEYKTGNYIKSLYDELNKAIKSFNAMKSVALRYGLNVEEIPEPNPPINEQTGTVTASSLNVRTGPSKSDATIGSLTKNSKVAVIGVADTGWYQVKLENGDTGYVSPDYLDVSV
ncbi:MAG: SH3 domain-containing protein [Bacilli bacterium]|nr:SH3 domain-containing protein [Bacilli bacterium]